MQPPRAPLALLVLSALAARAQPAAPLPGSSPQLTASAIAENRGTAALYESLRRLDTGASLLMIVAHPDDEDGGMLTYESRALGVRTGLFTLTRGEGGQNAMSAADYDALGLIRTQELLSADAYYGVSQQYWGTVADYGFSKTMEEALSQWGHQRVLYDAVRAVRLFRPLVVCSVFVGGVTDGHGHHQVAGMLAQEVFRAAGDPHVFPDQIAAGLAPWSPLKVYGRVPDFSLSPQGMFDYATGKYAPVRFHDYVNGTDIDHAPEANVTIAAGTPDPLAGETYLQIGRRGLGEQRSQHEGPVVPLPGPAASPYHRYGSRVPAAAAEQSFFDGIDTSLPGIARRAAPDGAFLQQPLQQIHALLSDAIARFDPARPQQTAEPLLAISRDLSALLAQVEASALPPAERSAMAWELRVKQEQANTALAQALGVEMTALVSPQAQARGMEFYRSTPGSLPPTPAPTPASVTPGAAFRVRVHVSVPAGVKVQDVRLETPARENWTVQRLSAPGLEGAAERTPDGTAGDVLFAVTAGVDAAPTGPYFSRPSIEQPYYDVADPRDRNLSYAPYPVTAVATFSAGEGAPVRLAQVVQTMHVERGPGAVYAPLVVTPALSVSLPEPWVVLPLAAPRVARDFTLAAHVHASAAAAGSLRLDLPEGWSATPARAPFRLQAGEDAAASFTVHAPALASASYPVTAIAESEGHRFTSGYESAGYGSLIPTYLYRPALTRVRGVDLRAATSRRIGYVMGTGDQLPTAIRQLGFQVDELSPADLAGGDLSRYQTIVVGIRAYGARPDLRLANARLLAWTHAGGTLVVMYQRAGYDQAMAPYPLRFNASGIPENVVDERDPVRILDPSDPLLAAPNRITAADFEGWQEERGHSFLSSWAPEYAAPTETHDPGQDEQRGGLVHAGYGRGQYIYVAFALYRQTASGVPGAYRLLANLLSAGGSEPAPSARGAAEGPTR